MTKIYTKKGDSGETSLIGGKRVLKSDPRVGACGNIDELNSVIGIVFAKSQISKLKTQNQNLKLKSELIKIQNDLFEIGSALVDPKEEKAQFLEKRVKEIEVSIDELSEDLPDLKHFILPGGGEEGSMLHFARTVARRAERKIVELSQKESIDDNILKYLNRLSDFLFIMARFINLKENKKEIIWH